MDGEREALTGEDEEQEDHNEGVSKVEEGAGEILNIQLGHIIVNAVEEKVDRCETTGQEGSPPPVVVLQEEGHHHGAVSTMHSSWT